MHERSELYPVGDNGDTIRVYTGYFTKLVTVDLDLAIPYYTSLRAALMGMSCVEQLKRGGGSSPSKWRLITAPTLEAYGRYENRGGTGRNAPKSKIAQQAGQIRDLNARIDALEAAFGDVLEAISSGAA
jgi:hypothetical protein